MEHVNNSSNTKMRGICKFTLTNSFSSDAKASSASTSSSAFSDLVVIAHQTMQRETFASDCYYAREKLGLIIDGWWMEKVVGDDLARTCNLI